MKHHNIKKEKKKIYGEDLRYVRIYEMIKMRAPISASDRDYYLQESGNYEIPQHKDGE